MICEGGKITAATERELWRLYLDRDMDEIMDFHQYCYLMERAGCRILERDGDSKDE